MADQITLPDNNALASLLPNDSTSGGDDDDTKKSKSKSDSTSGGDEALVDELYQQHPVDQPTQAKPKPKQPEITTAQQMGLEPVEADNTDKDIASQTGITPVQTKNKDDDDSFLTNTIEGLDQTWHHVVGNTAYFGGTVASDMGQRIAGSDMKKWGDEYAKSAPAPDGSYGQMTGSIVGYTLPAIGSVLAAPFTGGTSLEALPAILTSSGFVASSAGAGMRKYRDYKKAKGEKPNPVMEQTIGALYGAVMGVASEYGLNKIMPKGLGRVVMAGDIRPAEKEAANLLEKYAAQNAGKFRNMVGHVLNASEAGAKTVGSINLGNDFVNLIYQHSKDRKETIKNMIPHAAKGALFGAAMGPLTGPFSYASQQKANIERRASQGAVFLGESAKDGRIYELVNPIENEKFKGYQALSPDGESVLLKRSDIARHAVVSPAQFDQILDGKVQAYKQEVKHRDPVEIADYNGTKVQIKGEDGEGGYYIIIPGKDGAEPTEKNVAADELDNILEITPEQQLDAEGKRTPDGPTAPVEHTRTMQLTEGADNMSKQVLELPNGDMAYPGSPEHAQEMQRRQAEGQTPQDNPDDPNAIPADQKPSEAPAAPPVEKTVGSGKDKTSVIMQPEQDGSFTVNGQRAVRDGQEVRQATEDMSDQEIEALRENLEQGFANRDFEVVATPADPADPTSPMELRVVPSGQGEQPADQPKKTAQPVTAQKNSENKVPDEPQDQESLQQGSYGQWTSAGQDQFARPKKITDIQRHEDGNDYVRFEGEKTYVPAQEVTPVVAGDQPTGLSEGNEQGKPGEPNVFKEEKRPPKGEVPKVGDYNPEFKDSPKALGVIDSVVLPTNEEHQMQYAIVDINSILPSHNPNNFTPSDGFPKLPDGATPNDNDYGKSSDARDQVFNIETNLNNKLYQDTPIISTDGIVVSGNNRTMSTQRAVQKNSKEYLKYKQGLDKFAERYNIPKEDYKDIQNPVLVRIDRDVPNYSTDTFRTYNQTEKKQKSDVEAAVVVSKTIEDSTIQRLVNALNTDHNSTIRESLDSKTNARAAIDVLRRAKIIDGNTVGKYYDQDASTVTSRGRDFIELVALGAVLDAQALRNTNVAGVKSFAQKITYALPTLLKIKALGQAYDVSAELSEAVNLQRKIKEQGLNARDMYAQQGLFGQDKVSDKIKFFHYLLNNGRNLFKRAMQTYATSAGKGGANMFDEGTRSKADILNDLYDYVQQDATPEQQAELRSIRQGNLDRPGHGQSDQREPRGGEPGRPEGDTGAQRQRGQDQPVDGSQFKDGWRESIVKARDAANKVGVSHQGKDLDHLVGEIEQKLEGNNQAPPEGKEVDQAPEEDPLPEQEAQAKQKLKDLFKEFSDRAGSTLNAGIDPELIKIAGKIIKEGATLGHIKFKQLADFVTQNMGADYWRKIFPEFKSAYAAHVVGEGNPHNEDLNALSTSRANDYLEETPINPAADDTGTADDLEPNSPREEPENPVGPEAVQRPAGADRPADRPADNKNERDQQLPEEDQQRGNGRAADAAGEQGDTGVPGQPQPGGADGRAAVGAGRGGGNDPGSAQTHVEQNPAGPTPGSAGDDAAQTAQRSLEQRRQAQDKIEGGEPGVGDPDPARQTQTKAFKNWFGDSKVVDKDGEPLVVYHGTPDSRGLREGFKSNTERLLGQKDTERVFFFSDQYAMADSYADDRRAYDYQGATPETLSTYLSLQNPLVIDAKGESWNKFEYNDGETTAIGTREIVSLAKENGHDGIIIKNVRDNYNGNENTKSGTVYGVFSPTQIKSATGNRGTFDPTNPDIRYSKRSKSFERKQLEAQLEAARKEYQAAQRSLRSKRTELEGTLQEDAENLFGERKSSLDAKLFDMRADPKQVEKALEPFRRHRQAAKDKLSKVRAKMRAFKGTGQQSLRLSHPPGPTVDERAVSPYPTQADEKLRAQIETDIHGWAARDKIHVVSHPSQLPVEVQQRLRQQDGRIGGFFYDGHAYVLAQNLRNKAEADKVLAHEAIGHLGIRGLIEQASDSKQAFEKEFDALREEVYETFKDEDRFKEIVDEYNLDTDKQDDRYEAAEEFIADMAENEPAHPLLQKVIDFVRKILDKLGLTGGMTRSDIRNMLADARAYVEGGPVVYREGDLQRAFSIDNYMREAHPAEPGQRFKVVAWHGSPHVFDTFSSDAIGTGEGAQAFGWGLYFTDVEDIARWYAEENATNFDLIIEGKQKNIPVSMRGDFKNSQYVSDLVKYYTNDEGLDASSALKKIFDIQDNIIDEKSTAGYLSNSKVISDAKKTKHIAYDLLQKVDKNQKIEIVPQRNLYQVSLHEGKEPGQYDWLEWDEKIDKATYQTFKDQLQAAVEDGMLNKDQAQTLGEELARIDDHIGSDDFYVTGEGLYRMLHRVFGSGKQASHFLLNHGIDGIRYPANQGRSEGTNYVVFDDDVVSIDDHIRYKKMGGGLAEDDYFNKKRFDGMVERFQDLHVATKRLQEGIKAAGGTVTDAEDAYTDQTLAYGRTEDQLKKLKRNRRDPLYDKMNALNNDKGIGYEDVDAFLKARHAPERNDYLYERYKAMSAAQQHKHYPGYTDQQLHALSGISDEDAAATLKTYEQKGWTGELEDVAADVYRITQETNDNLVAKGLMSGARYGHLKKMFDYYVPMRGFKEFEDYDHTLYSGDMKMKGRTSESGPVLPYVFAMAETGIIKGEKNITKQHLGQLAIKNPDFADQIKVRNMYWRDTGELDEATGKKKFAPTFQAPTAQQAMSGYVKRTLDLDTETGAAFGAADAGNPMTKGDRHLPFKKNGRTYVLEFKTPHIAQAFKGATKDEANWLLRKVGAYSRFLRHMITEYSPEFGPRNFTRDTFEGFINMSIDHTVGDATKALHIGRTAGKMMPVVWRGLRGDYSGELGQSFKTFEEVGGMTGYWQLDDVSKRFDDLKAAVEKGGLGKNPGTWTKDQVKKLGGVMEHYNETLENATRFSVYHYLTSNDITNPDTGKPYTNKQAANYARNLTVNFNRKGTASNTFGSLFLFFNAQVQGIARMAQPFFSEHTRTRWRAAATPIVMAASAQLMIEILRRAMGKDDDDEYYYDKINEWTRTHYFIFPNPISEDPSDYLRIPMPYGYNAYWAAGDALNRLGHGVASVSDVLMETGVAALDSFNPVGTASGSDFKITATKTFTPTILKPGLELATNENFAGRPIKPEPFPFAPAKPASQQYFPWVASWAKNTASYLNKVSGGDEVTGGYVDISPEYMEYVVRYFGGGAGQFASNLAAFGPNVYDAITGEDALEKQDIYATPFAHSYYGVVTDGATRRAFYDNADTIQNLYYRYESYIDNGNRQKAQQVMEANRAVMMLKPRLKAIRKQMRSLRKMQDMYEVRARNAEDKKARKANKKAADKVGESIHEMHLAFNKMMNQAKNNPTKRPVDFLKQKNN